MKVIYEERTFKEMSEPLMIGQSDDAWHPLKDRNYIEWWYFDVMNSDQSIIRGQFHISRDFFWPAKMRTGVRATHVKPDGTEINIDEKLPFSHFKASTEVCDLEIGNNFLKGDLSHYELHIEDSEKSLDLELDAEMEGLKSYACFGDERTYMYWVVPQPRSRAKGTFQTKDEIFKIDGLGYRDHNWLNFSPPDVIEYWDWGRVYDTEFTVIFADIVTTKRYSNAKIKPLVIYDSSKLLYLTTESLKWSLTKADMKFDPETRTERPETHRVVAEDGDLSLEMDLHLERVFQKIDPLADFNPVARFLMRTFKGKPSITSFFSRGSGKLNLPGSQNALTCAAVHELVRNS